MSTWLSNFLVALALAILDKGFAKGTAAYQKVQDLKKIYEDDLAKAKKYREAISKPDATREDRKRAEDDLLS